MDMKIKYGFRIYALVICPFLCSCEKFLTLNTPRDQVVTKTIYEDDALAEGAITGIYYEMFNGTGNNLANGGSASVTALMGLIADELNYNESEESRAAFSAVNYLSTTTGVAHLWNSAYKAIFRANDVLEGLNISVNVSAAKKSQLQGEALFIRAFCHFYLVNMYGPIPLVLTTDYRVTQSLPRETEQNVYNQIITDLLVASEHLPVDYTILDGQRVRPIRWTAKALLARAYLYQGLWKEAAEKAGEVIDQAGLYSLMDDPAGVFLKNSREAIWQLYPATTTVDTWEGYFAIPDPIFSLIPAYTLHNDLWQRFESGDKRVTAWIGIHTPPSGTDTYLYPAKFKIKSNTSQQPHQEYSMVMRLAEQYLIRSEALAQLGDLAGALDDLNAIRRNHGGLQEIKKAETRLVLADIENERYKEFFYEWGHRWFDLKRWGKAESVLGALKPDWRSEALLLPIPRREMEANPSLIQNPGYH